MLLDAELVQGAGRLGRQLRAERGERGVPAIEKQHPGVLGLDVTVFVAQRLGRHLAELPGQLHARGSGTDQGEGEPAAAFRRVDRGIRHLERAEDAAPDDQGILDGLHAGRPRGILVVPEIRLLHPGRHDQVVVAELQLVPERPRRQDPAPFGIDAGHLGQHEVRVLLLTEQIPQRVGDLPLGQDPGRALVQQRLEQVVRAPVDEGHPDRGAAQHPGGEQPGESAADDHHAALAILVVHGASPIPVVIHFCVRLSLPGRTTFPGWSVAAPPPWDPSCPWRRGARGRHRRAPGRRSPTRLPRCPAGRTASGPRLAPRR